MEPLDYLLDVFWIKFAGSALPGCFLAGYQSAARTTEWFEYYLSWVGRVLDTHLWEGYWLLCWVYIVLCWILFD